MARVFAVEDSRDTQVLLVRALSSHRVSVASTIRQGLDQIRHDPPDILLLDRALPDGDGLDLFKQLREEARFENLPVMFLTACTDVEDKVSAFSMGAEDYIEKPFVPAELLARVEARLRRQSGERTEPVTVGELELDPVRHTVRGVGPKHSGLQLQLTPLEFRILHTLALRCGTAVERPELMQAVWGDVLVSERTLDTHVSNLRRKLGSAGDGLRAVRGIGYRFDLGSSH